MFTQVVLCQKAIKEIFPRCVGGPYPVTSDRMLPFAISAPHQIGADYNSACVPRLPRYEDLLVGVDVNNKGRRWGEFVGE